MRTIQLDKQLSEQIIATILHYSQPRRIILYGSRATGKATHNSDIDLALEAEQDLSFLHPILEKEVPTLCKFDLVQLAKAGAALKQEIAREGIVIYEKV